MSAQAHAWDHLCVVLWLSVLEIDSAGRTSRAFGTISAVAHSLGILHHLCYMLDRTDVSRRT